MEYGQHETYKLFLLWLWIHHNPAKFALKNKAVWENLKLLKETSKSSFGTEVNKCYEYKQEVNRPNQTKPFDSRISVSV